MHLVPHCQHIVNDCLVVLTYSPVLVARQKVTGTHPLPHLGANHFPVLQQEHNHAFVVDLGHHPEQLKAVPTVLWARRCDKQGSCIGQALPRVVDHCLLVGV